MVLKRATFTDFARGWSNVGANLQKKSKVTSRKSKECEKNHIPW